MLFDEEMMLRALAEAEKAAAEGEVPVGAVVLDGDGAVIAEAHNIREAACSPTAHAEIAAIEAAAEHLGRRRLSDCTLYVTLEPCPMCAGAVINAGLKRLVYGAFDEKGGACSSVINLFECGFPHNTLVRSRVLEKECAEILSRFFAEIRTEERQASKSDTA